MGEAGALFSPCCLTWSQTIMEIMKITATSFKRSHACAAALSAPKPAAGHHRPTPLPQTSGHSRASLGQSLGGSLLLPPESWCTHGFVCPLQESVYPVLCKFWRLSGGVNSNLLQEVLCHTQVSCTQSPAPTAVHCWPISPQETLKHSSGSVSVGSLGPGGHKVCLSPLCVWWVWGLILNVILPLWLSCWSFSFALGYGVSFFWWDPTFDDCPVTSCNFGVLAGEAEHTSFYSNILES